MYKNCSRDMPWIVLESLVRFSWSWIFTFPGLGTDLNILRQDTDLNQIIDESIEQAKEITDWSFTQRLSKKFVENISKINNFCDTTIAKAQKLPNSEIKQRKGRLP